MELYNANREWKNRPQDERFWTLTDARNTARTHRERSRETFDHYQRLRVQPIDGDLRVVGDDVPGARLSHWSFGQLATRCGAPANYLRTLSDELVAMNLNYKLGHSRGEAQVLLLDSETPVVRAFTSDEYVRVWSDDVLNRCLDLEARGWRVPPARPVRGSHDPLARPATEADILQSRGDLSINVGDLIAPAGIYVSDHDMFVFLISEAKLKDGSSGGLNRGVFITNSDVGACSLRVTYFWYRTVCGNHIVWDATNVKEFRFRHVGEVVERTRQVLEHELPRYAESSTAKEEAQIRSAQTFKLGETRDEVLEKATSITELPRKAVAAAFDEIVLDEDGDPYTAWAFVQGLTRYSQATPYQDARDRLDRAAARILRLAA